MTGPIRPAMARKLTGRLKILSSSRQGLNFQLSTQTGGGSVVGLLVSRQAGQQTESAGTVAVYMAQGGIIWTDLCPLMNLSMSTVQAMACTGAGVVVEGETGTLGDLVLTTLPEGAVMPIGEADVRGSNAFI